MNTATIQPWLTFSDCFKALEFYKVAFGAKEVYHFEPAEGELIARLELGGAEFWIASGAPGDLQAEQRVRFIVIVHNPEAFCQAAVAAGATEIYGVREEYGWYTGKVADPFGYHWEFGHELAT